MHKKGSSEAWVNCTPCHGKDLRGAESRPSLVLLLPRQPVGREGLIVQSGLTPVPISVPFPTAGAAVARAVG